MASIIHINVSSVCKGPAYANVPSVRICTPCAMQQPSLRRRDHTRATMVRAYQLAERMPTRDAITPEKVADVMTSQNIYTIGPDNTVDEALQIIVSNRVSGLPVIDSDGIVVGVVSDYDLLNLDGVLAEKEQEQEGILFPEVGKSWKAFNDIKTLLAKTGGHLVQDVMTANPYTIQADMTVDAAARCMMIKRIRRLPVVDQEGHLVGVLSRGNIVKAVLQHHQSAKNAVKQP